METILFFTDLLIGPHLAELNGVFDRAKTHGWRVVPIEYSRTDRPASHFIRHWKPAGCIVECGHLGEALKVSAYASVPTVFIDADEDAAAKKKIFNVRNDPYALCDLAANELSALEPKSYAFVGWCTRKTWVDRRRMAFARRLKEHGVKRGMYHEYLEPWDRGNTVDFQKRLAKWLATLPTPCGILAANDQTAAQVVTAAEAAKLRVPDDISIIGVDNDPLHCENSIPSLTSIEPDFRGGGAAAAELLAEKLAAPGTEPRQIDFKPLGIIRRGSTRRLTVPDFKVREALERIRRDACTGLSAKDVIAEFHCSRRLAEQRFKKATGRSIGEEIIERRFERVFELLADRKEPIALIAGDCGWQTESFLSRTFKKRTGMTMREWRNANT